METEAGPLPQDRERCDERLERVTVRMPKDLIAELDRRVENGEYNHRSEAIRDTLRQQITDGDQL